MRIFRKKPFYWGTKEVTRYLRYKYSGHELVLRLAVYNALCEIESDFEGKAVKSFAKVIARYSGIKRQSVNEIVKEFYQLGIVSTYGKPKKDGKFGYKYLVLEDKVPNVPKKDIGRNQLQSSLFGAESGDTKLTDVPITDVGKQDIYKKVNNIEVKSNLAAGKKPSAHRRLFKLFYEELVPKIRNFKPKITRVEGAKEGKNLKQVLDLGVLSETEIEQIMVFFLAELRTFSPLISVCLSAGVLNGLMNRMKNDPSFWKRLDGYGRQFLRQPATDDDVQKLFAKLDQFKKSALKIPLTSQERTKIQEETAAAERN